MSKKKNKDLDKSSDSPQKLKRKAFERLEGEQRDAFSAELKALAVEFNEADDGTLVIPGEYLEVVLSKR